MIFIDKTGQNGNVFAVLGIFKNYTKQVKEVGVDVSEHEKLLSCGYTSMNYDEILAKVTDLSDGYIVFTDGRKTKNLYL